MKLRIEFFYAILFAFLLVIPLAEARWSWPRYLKRLAANEPGARLRHFRSLLVWEWGLTLAFLGVWALAGQPWNSLLLHQAAPIQSYLFLLFSVLMIVVFLRQRRAILARPATVERLRKRLEFARPLMPHTPAERRMFWAVSATAGICEETLYRGFLPWYLAGFIVPRTGALTGIWIAITLSSLIFGLGHIYLGVNQVPRTALVGLFLAVLTYFSGSLWPSMVLHAAIDWNSGELGYAMLNLPRSVSSGADDPLISPP